jgi:hypothetical protein
MAVFNRTCHRWLCGIESVRDGFAFVQVRRSRCAEIKTVRIAVGEFFERVNEAYDVVTEFWLQQIRRNTQHRNPCRVDLKIQRESSWILGIDLSEKGEFCLRFLIGEVLGYYSLQETSQDDICAAMLCRKLPSFQQLVDRTPFQK